MSNGTTDVTAETKETTTTAETQPTPLVNAEGVLSENWRESLPEDIRGEKVFDRAKDFPGLMRSLASAERMIGKDKIAIPNESSGDDEWNAYWSAGGRPDTVEEYGFARPDDFPEELYSEDYAKEVQDIIFKNGGSKKLAEALFAHSLEFALKQVQKQSDDEALEFEQLKTDLITLWGNSYEEKRHFGNIAIEEGVSEMKGGAKTVDTDFKARIVEKFGNDPDFIRFASNLGVKFAESKGIKPGTTPAPTSSEIDTKIQEAMKSEAYNNRNHPGHKAAVELVTRLHKEKAALTGKPA